MKRKVLILEDDEKLANFYKSLILLEGLDAKATYNSTEFLSTYQTFKPDVIILDIRLANSELDGLQVYQYLVNEKLLESKVIILSGEASRTEVAKAMQLGAYTFIEKNMEFNGDKFISDIKQAINLKIQEDYNKDLRDKNKFLKDTIIHNYPFIGKSQQIKKIKELIQKFSSIDTDVLIVGETGTGKEVVANQIYWNSKRAGKPFIKVNAGGISDTLVESELFGHKKGTFTGAISDKKGYFEQADGGTLFLDEISNLNMNIQAKILRAIEHKEIQVLGGKLKKIDVNFIFASNAKIEDMINKGNFRSDLYYRLSKNVIYLPPLREREEDIPVLFEFFVNKFSEKHKKISKINYFKIKNSLINYSWPGNVRELEYFCEHLFIIYNKIDEKIVINELEEKRSGTNFNKCSDELKNIYKIENYSSASDKFEMNYFTYHLEKNDWNVEKTAFILGLDRSTLYKKIKKLKLKRR